MWVTFGYCISDPRFRRQVAEEELEVPPPQAQSTHPALGSVSMYSEYRSCSGVLFHETIADTSYTSLEVMPTFMTVMTDPCPYATYIVEIVLFLRCCQRC